MSREKQLPVLMELINSFLAGNDLRAEMSRLVYQSMVRDTMRIVKCAQDMEIHLGLNQNHKWRGEDARVYEIPDMHMFHLQHTVQLFERCSKAYKDTGSLEECYKLTHLNPCVNDIDNIWPVLTFGLYLRLKTEYKNRALRDAEKGAADGQEPKETPEAS